MYVLKVEGMTCQGCVNAVNSSIKKIDEGAEVGVDLLKKEVRVESERTEQEVRAALEDSGYDVLEVWQQ